jgi:acylphosphatase
VRRVYLLINGLVTGVGFRFQIVNIGQDLDLRGWCRNVTDTQVEVVAEGEEESLQNFIKRCHIGPPGAKVEEVKVTWSEAEGNFDGFTVKY